MDMLDVFYVLRGTLMQFVLFLIIPFIWWLIRYRKNISFLKWLGVFGVKKKLETKKVVLWIGIYWVVWIITHLPIITQYTQMSANSFTNAGVLAIIPCLIICFIQNGFVEEALFRGFLLKRILTKLDFKYANLIQAGCFGLFHILFSPGAGITTWILLMVTTTIGGWILGYINEKVFNGSIIPSVLLHGMGNFIVNMSFAFALV